ncbi:ATP-binding protein [Streptomyces sp. B1866]|uniref:ATP-binding protein n=1 Tax=Streptomyces sp. B1866 TaxID=3075431 RepID=UPI0028900E90|nr:ATP-binding protein [Streptomyces sp. B1866]MDT3395969.1 ATP-binding protein [Streptomyces sp. B1866]
MTHHILEAVTWALAAAVLVALLLLLRQRGIAARARRRAAELEEDVRARDAELRHLVAVRLPAAADSVTRATPVPGPREAGLEGSTYAQSTQAVLDLFTRSLEKAHGRADVATRAALKSTMRALQGLAHEQQAAISAMQERHDDPDVLQDLLEIDHTNSQFGRRAQAISVLCGSWPGRQRAVSSLIEVVRGATSRIRDYRRVRVHSEIDIAVTSRAVEPVVLTVAELLDNAARHSQPNTTVEVQCRPVHNGACVIVDDAGVGLGEQDMRRAAELLSGERPVDVSRLGDPPQFGFAAIGVLAARYGFTVSVDTRSPYGGARAVVFLPSALLTPFGADGPSVWPTRRPPGAPRSHAGRERPVLSPLAHPAVDDEEEDDVFPRAPGRPYESTAGGLPKRRRRPRHGRDPGGHARPGAEEGEPSGAYRVRSAEEAAQRMGAFARGTRSGRAAAEDPAHHHDEGNHEA